MGLEPTTFCMAKVASVRVGSLEFGETSGLQRVAALSLEDLTHSTSLVSAEARSQERSRAPVAGGSTRGRPPGGTSTARRLGGFHGPAPDLGHESSSLRLRCRVGPGLLALS
jgi:hypothetical protein